MTVTFEHTASPPTFVALDSATVGDLMSPPELQISDDVLIDTAIDILHSAHADFAVVRGHDGRCTGLLTSAQLMPFHTRTRYAECTAIRELVPDTAPFARSGMPAEEAAAVMRERDLEAWPVVDEDGYTIGVLTRGQL